MHGREYNNESNCANYIQVPLRCRRRTVIQRADLLAYSYVVTRWPVQIVRTNWPEKNQSQNGNTRKVP
jgi:hypothetical protein